MNILYIAYSCAPDSGSEDKIGWNVPVESARHNNVFVITKKEHQKTIDEYLKKNVVNNIYFYYIDIPKIVKKVFKGFLYSGRLNIWHRHAEALAQKICEEKNIEIIHQITPVEFRSIGNYGKISGVKFVCGPLGGGEVIPKPLVGYAKNHIGVELIRTLVNRWYWCIYGLTGKLNNCDFVLYANEDTKVYLGDLVTCECKVFSDIGISESELRKKEQTINDHRECVFLVAGRLIYRKGHDFLLDALEMVPDELDYRCRIVGDGPEFSYIKERCQHSKKLTRHVSLVGKIPYHQMEQEYQRADVFIMPSIRETGGSVLLEAASKAIPCVTIGRFGAVQLFDSSSAWFYNGMSKEEMLERLKEIIVFCIKHPIEIRRRGEKAYNLAKQYTWGPKVQYFSEIYNQLIN